jgi:hydrogenase/urease accessory protein HupE
MNRARSCLALAALLLALPSVALAHLVNSGLGPFYDGALHLLLSPGDLLGLLAAALLAGLRGPRAGRLTVMVLPVAWLLAGLIGLHLPSTLELPWLSVLSWRPVRSPRWQGCTLYCTACSTGRHWRPSALDRRPC